ncbi:hypothetical protein Cgig2_008723 [Carnegiea gigantea]|uniref:Uncharacterized protein n=1 Tax=Carnegiea gigantea TaxID=171969 RepID=A0A9Q1QGM8_9CARY|nr:hypothetical protein Cgig2_008723 [Carnegiea gigantea]
MSLRDFLMTENQDNPVLNEEVENGEAAKSNSGSSLIRTIIKVLTLLMEHTPIGTDYRAYPNVRLFRFIVTLYLLTEGEEMIGIWMTTKYLREAECDLFHAAIHGTGDDNTHATREDTETIEKEVNLVSDSQKCLEKETFGSWMLVQKPKRKLKSSAKLGVDKTTPAVAVEQQSEEGVTNFESDVPSMEPTPNANKEDGMYSPAQSESQIKAFHVRIDSLRKVTLPQAKQKNKESFLERVSLPIYRGVVEGVQHSSVSSPNSLEDGRNVYGPTLYDIHDGGSQKATDPRSGDNPGVQDHITDAAMDEAEGGIARNNDLLLPQQEIKRIGGTPWFFSTVYASPDSSHRRLLSEEHTTLAASIDNSWRRAENTTDPILFLALASRFTAPRSIMRDAIDTTPSSALAS